MSKAPWEIFEHLSEPGASFVLWLVNSGVCRSRLEIRAQFRSPVEIDCQVEALLRLDLLREENGVLSVTQQGRYVLGDLALDCQDACEKSDAGQAASGSPGSLRITEVRISLRDDEKLKAFVSITFDGCFVIRGLKIIKGSRGLFLAMPARKRADGTFQDLAHPINDEARSWLEGEVLARYQEELQSVHTLRA